MIVRQNNDRRIAPQRLLYHKSRRNIHRIDNTVAGIDNIEQLHAVVKKQYVRTFYGEPYIETYKIFSYLSDRSVAQLGAAAFKLIAPRDRADHLEHRCGVRSHTLHFLYLVDISLQDTGKRPEALDEQMRRLVYVALRDRIEQHKLHDLVRAEGIKSFIEKAFLQPRTVPVMRAHNLELVVFRITS